MSSVPSLPPINPLQETSFSSKSAGTDHGHVTMSQGPVSRPINGRRLPPIDFETLSPGEIPPVIGLEASAIGSLDRSSNSAHSRLTQFSTVSPSSSRAPSRVSGRPIVPPIASTFNQSHKDTNVQIAKEKMICGRNLISVTKLYILCTFYLPLLDAVVVSVLMFTDLGVSYRRPMYSYWLFILVCAAEFFGQLITCLALKLCKIRYFTIDLAANFVLLILLSVDSFVICMALLFGNHKNDDQRNQTQFLLKILLVWQLANLAVLAMALKLKYRCFKSLQGH